MRAHLFALFLLCILISPSGTCAAQSIEETIGFINETTVGKARGVVPSKTAVPEEVQKVTIEGDDLKIFLDSRTGGQIRVDLLEVRDIGWGTTSGDGDIGIEKGEFGVWLYCKKGSKCASYRRPAGEEFFSTDWGANILFNKKSDSERTGRAFEHLLNIVTQRPQKQSPF
jgi:hypothetical protein